MCAAINLPCYAVASERLLRRATFVSRNFYASVNLDKAIWLLSIDPFSKKMVVCSSAVPEILAFGSHCSACFQPFLDCFIPKFKYEDSENIKADCVSTIIFSLHQIKRRAFFWDTRYISKRMR